MMWDFWSLYRIVASSDDLFSDRGTPDGYRLWTASAATRTAYQRKERAVLREMAL